MSATELWAQLEAAARAMAGLGCYMAISVQPPPALCRDVATLRGLEPFKCGKPHPLYEGAPVTQTWAASEKVGGVEVSLTWTEPAEPLACPGSNRPWVEGRAADEVAP